MKLRKKWVILLAMAVLAIVLVIVVLGFLPADDTPEAKARAEAKIAFLLNTLDWLISVAKLEFSVNPSSLGVTP